MVNLGSFLILSCGIIAHAINGARSDDCITYQHSLKYYHELNCIPTRDEAKNCITSFNCSSIFTQREDKCYYQGKEYSIGQDLNQDEIRSNCIPGCRCSSPFGRAQFSCPHVDCPENFQPPLEPNCVRTYSHDSCCATGKHCEGNNAEPKVAKCEYGGNVYTEGSSFYPDETPCKKCICKPGFNGTLDSPWCEDIFCEIEIHYSDNVQEACAPVYYGKKSCCPIYFHCQSQSEQPIVIEGIQTDNPTQKTNDDSHQCKFGNMTVEIGRKITPPDECIECSCSVPPFVSCILDGECQERQRSGQNQLPTTKSGNN